MEPEEDPEVRLRQFAYWLHLMKKDSVYRPLVETNDPGAILIHYSVCHWCQSFVGMKKAEPGGVAEAKRRFGIK